MTTMTTDAPNSHLNSNHDAKCSDSFNASSNMSYKLSYKISNLSQSATENRRITRIGCERDMFLCILNSESSKYNIKSLFGHKSIAVVYPTDLRPPNKKQSVVTSFLSL